MGFPPNRQTLGRNWRVGKPPYDDLNVADLELVQRWVDGMAWLRHAADPSNGRALDRSRGRSAETPEPGQSTKRYRNAVRRATDGLRRECEKVELALDDPTPRTRGKRCPKCGRGGRPGAEICDRKQCAGTELEEK